MTILYIYIEQTNECIDTIVADTIEQCLEIAKEHYSGCDYRWISREPDDIATCELGDGKYEVDIKLEVFKAYVFKHNYVIRNNDPEMPYPDYFYGEPTVVQVNTHNKQTQIDKKATDNCLLSRIRQLFRKLWY